MQEPQAHRVLKEYKVLKATQEQLDQQAPQVLQVQTELVFQVVL
jgi:hypothetical protein